jgi:hypothetical protein
MKESAIEFAIDNLTFSIHGVAHVQATTLYVVEVSLKVCSYVVVFNT